MNFTKSEDKNKKDIELNLYLCLNLLTNSISLIYNIILGFTYLLLHKNKNNNRKINKFNKKKVMIIANLSNVICENIFLFI